MVKSVKLGIEIINVYYIPRQPDGTFLSPLQRGRDIIDISIIILFLVFLWHFFHWTIRENYLFYSELCRYLQGFGFFILSGHKKLRVPSVCLYVLRTYIIHCFILCISVSSTSNSMTTTARSSMHRLCWSFVSRCLLRWMLYTKFMKFLIKQVKSHSIFFPGGGGGGVHSHKHWVAMYGLLPKTLTLFMTWPKLWYFLV